MVLEESINGLALEVGNPEFRGMPEVSGKFIKRPVEMFDLTVK